MDLTDPSEGKRIWDGDKIVRLGGTSPLADVEKGGDPGRRFMIGLSILLLVASGVLWLRGYLRNRRAASP
jgi:hypothetical protein